MYGLDLFCLTIGPLTWGWHVHGHDTSQEQAASRMRVTVLALVIITELIVQVLSGA